MTKEGYTHIIVPKDLHEILKREAKARDMSISQYITEILSQIQSIKGLVSDDSGINTLKKKVLNLIIMGSMRFERTISAS